MNRISMVLCRALVCGTLLKSSAMVTGNTVRADEVRITVDTGSVIRKMAGGIGASWHAIEEPITDQYDPRFGLTLHGGSGWGGNPPVSNRAAWEQMVQTWDPAAGRYLDQIAPRPNAYHLEPGDPGITVE